MIGGRIFCGKLLIISILRAWVVIVCLLGFTSHATAMDAFVMEIPKI